MGSSRASIPAGTSMSTVRRGLTVGIDVAYYVVHECRATKCLSHRGVDTDRKAGFTRFILQRGKVGAGAGLGARLMSDVP